jgi:LPS export ABC transporter protein LptC
MVSICLIFSDLTNISWVKIELPKNRPEYNGYGVSGMVYGKNGNVLYRMVSESIWQYPSNERIFMSNLHTIAYSESNPQTVLYDLTASDGWMNYGKRLGFLGNNTVLQIIDATTKQTTTIYGKNIDLDFARNYLQSKENVKTVQKGLIITGKGFTYDKNTESLHVLSNVNINYTK